MGLFRMLLLFIFEWVVMKSLQLSWGWREEKGDGVDSANNLLNINKNIDVFSLPFFPFIIIINPFLVSLFSLFVWVSFLSSFPSWFAIRNGRCIRKFENA